MSNHYDTLGVPRDADETAIKKAFRTLSLKYHPDRNSATDSIAKFQAINEAYEHLSDPQRRAQYDAELNGFRPGGIHVMEPDIGNIFNMMFGGGGMPMGGSGIHMQGMPGGIHVFHMGGDSMFGGPGMGGMGGMEHIFRQMNKPPSIIQNVDITFEQAYHGCTLHVNVEKWTIRNDLKITEIEVMYLTIPAGVDNEEVIVLRDCGNTVNEQLKGDVKFIVRVAGHPEFTRHGMDLILKKQLSLKEALTGFSFEVIHVNGKLLTLNNKTKSTVIHPNYKKTIPGLGMIRDNNKGNLIIEFDVIFPTSLTQEQIETLTSILQR
jgi:DnaJ family protein B protein 4